MPADTPYADAPLVAEGGAMSTQQNQFVVDAYWHARPWLQLQAGYGVAQLTMRARSPDGMMSATSDMDVADRGTVGATVALPLAGLPLAAYGEVAMPLIFSLGDLIGPGLSYEAGVQVGNATVRGRLGAFIEEGRLGAYQRYQAKGLMLGVGIYWSVGDAEDREADDDD